MQTHTFRQGECIATVADVYGFADWRTIYSHASNANFRTRNPDPNVILPGDKLRIPDRESGVASASTDARHTFKVAQPQVHVRLCLLDEKREPLTEARYEFAVGSDIHEGVTDEGGMLDHMIPIDAEYGEVTVWLKPDDDAVDNVVALDGEKGAAPASQLSPNPTDEVHAEAMGSEEDIASRWIVEFGCLDPIRSTSGVQARLHNLGFRCGPIDGLLGPLTKAAVEIFQVRAQITVDGIVGPQTKGKLQELYGR